MNIVHLLRLKVILPVTRILTPLILALASPPPSQDMPYPCLPFNLSKAFELLLGISTTHNLENI